MRDNLDASLKLVFGDEGGYSNRATDAGGATKFGVTLKTLAAHRGLDPAQLKPMDVQALTLAEARDIYVAGYWGQSGGDALPAGLDYAAFDFGVNSGPPEAVKKLQDVLGVPADGWIGPGTLAAVKAYPGGTAKLIRDYCDRRMAYLRSLRGKQGFSTNGRGWTIRVTGVDPQGQWAPTPGVVGNALAMVKAVPVAPKSNPLPAGGDSKAAPPKPNPMTKPEVYLPLAGAAGTVVTAAAPAVAPLANGPVLYAVAFAIVVVVLLGAFYAFLRIRRSTP